MIQFIGRGNSMNNVTGLVRMLRQEQERLTKELRGIQGSRSQLLATPTERELAPGRCRQQLEEHDGGCTERRWAKVRETAKVVPVPDKRTLSAAARKRQPVKKWRLRNGLDGRR